MIVDNIVKANFFIGSIADICIGCELHVVMIVASLGHGLDCVVPRLFGELWSLVSSID